MTDRTPEHRMIPHLYDEALTWIPEGARVLDLGSGDGAFLERLARVRKAHVEGVERDPDLVSRCIERHLIVHQGDILDGLDQYSAGSFEFVLLLGTFQEILDPQRVLREAFRVGRNVLIGYSNFAYVRARLQLLLRGRAPVTPSLPSSWYRTSNTHFFSILDFEEFCRETGLAEQRAAYFNRRGKVTLLHNFRAEQALSHLTSSAPPADPPHHHP